MINSVLQAGVNGIQQSSREIQRSADQIVKAGTTEKSDTTGAADIIAPTVRIMAEQHVFDASAKVVKVADETLGALLDVKA